MMVLLFQQGTRGGGGSFHGDVDGGGGRGRGRGGASPAIATSSGGASSPSPSRATLLDGIPLFRLDSGVAFAQSTSIASNPSLASASSCNCDNMGSPLSPTLWRPGSTSYPPVRQIMDPLQCKQELQQLYEQMSESSYDLSLRDIVDPCYSMSGNLKAVARESQEQNSSQKQKLSMQQSLRRTETKGAYPIQRLSFSFSFPRMKRSRDSSARLSSRTLRRVPSKSQAVQEKPPLSTHQTTQDRRSQASLKRSASACSKDRAQPKSSSSLYADNINNNKKRADFNQRAFSTSKVHPSNQCSSCSSYTIFFKSRCLVCGKLYCSNCAKDALENVTDGRKCKDTCASRPVSKRYLEKAGRTCWPFCGTTEVQRIQFKNINRKS